MLFRAPPAPATLRHRRRAGVDPVGRGTVLLLAAWLLVAQALLQWHGYTQHGPGGHAASTLTATVPAGLDADATDLHRAGHEEANCPICLSGAALGRALADGDDAAGRLIVPALGEARPPAVTAPVPGAIGLPPYPSRAPPQA